MKTAKKAAAVAAVLFLAGACQYAPENIAPVSGFDLNRYSGQWYEIARIDFFFEKGLSNVTAHYSLNEDGSVKVVNRGFDVRKSEWKEAVGKAKFRGDSSVGALKVSFFGSFYAGYNVVAVEEDYSSALVCGKNTGYLWILSRTPSVSEEVKTRYLNLAKALDYDTGRLVWVEHDQSEAAVSAE